MACSANVTDSSGVAGNRMLASAIRNVLIRHNNFIAREFDYFVSEKSVGRMYAESTFSTSFSVFSDFIIS